MLGHDFKTKLILLWHYEDDIFDIRTDSTVLERIRRDRVLLRNN